MKKFNSNDLLDEKFINEKIDEYDKNISDELYFSISKKFKEKILKKYNTYETITDNLLSEILRTSYFKELCYNEIDFIISNDEDFWVNELENALEKLIDFDKLRAYELENSR